MIFTEHSMPDGEVRIYCTKISSVVSYFTEDGDGGCTLMVEPGEFSHATPEIMEDTRQAILETIAHRLHCPVECVETRTLEVLRRLLSEKETPRHPWQHNRPRLRIKQPTR